MHKLKTYQFKEGTVIVEVSEEEEFDMEAETITETGRFTACIIGGTIPGLETAMVMDKKNKSEQIFPTAEAAYEGAYQLAIERGYHPILRSKKRAPKQSKQ